MKFFFSFLLFLLSLQSAMGYGEENLGASAVDTPDLVKTAAHAQHHSRMYDIVHDLTSKEPGSEGELPS